MERKAQESSERGSVSNNNRNEEYDKIIEDLNFRMQELSDINKRNQQMAKKEIMDKDVEIRMREKELAFRIRELEQR